MYAMKIYHLGAISNNLHVKEVNIVIIVEKEKTWWELHLHNI
jgi:hypothetical protein